MRKRLAHARETVRKLQTRLAAQPRQRLAAICAALCVLALTGTLFAFSAQPSAPNSRADLAPLTLPTATNTPTVGPKPTKKPTPRPTAPPQATKKPSSQPVSVPPPPPQPTPPPATPTPTPCPSPTATATPTPTAAPSPTDTATASPGGTATVTTTSTASRNARAASAASCTPCGQYSGNNPSQDTIRAALNAAATKYGLPARLLYGVAWQESKWHQDVVSCDGGIGLMQVQYYTYPWLNSVSQSGCDVAIVPTSYNDPYNSVQDNAYLGAKYLAWLKCLYAYNAQGGGTRASPANYSSEYDYFNAPSPALAYPDTKTLSGKSLGPCAPAAGSGTPTPTPTPVYGLCSLCDTLYQDNVNGPTDTLYQDIGDSAGIGGHWSCPFDPTKGISDYELLDLTLSAYNAGPGAISNCGCIPNLGYVGAVEYWITEFAQGILPK